MHARIHTHIQVGHLEEELAKVKMDVIELESRNSLLEKLSTDAKQIINKLQLSLTAANDKLMTNAEVLQEHTVLL